MGKHKKPKSKIPERRRPLPPHLQAQVQRIRDEERLAARNKNISDDHDSDDDWLEDDDWLDEDGFGCSGFEMIDFGEEFEFNDSVLIDGVLVSGKALRGSRSELPRLEDFASLEEYNLYHVRSMLAAGVSPDDIDLDFVLPSFVEAMQLETEKEIRSSLAWKNTIEQLGLEKAECMLRYIKPEVDEARRKNRAPRK